jgi:hypothetical protein
MIQTKRASSKRKEEIDPASRRQESSDASREMQ